MYKSLSDMSLEKLWRLFPVQLKPHDNHWSEQYEKEKAALEKLLPHACIFHIGSTAVKGIWAKPIVDILAEVKDIEEACSVLEKDGWICMSVSPDRISLNKGYTPYGFAKEVFHLHLRRFGDRDEVYFCSFLNENPKIAKEYEELKLTLWEKYEFDRDGYTAAKTAFVKKYTLQAKKSD